ncbi:MAG: hypothetical protein JXB04_04230 [Kiritimatiellae bacterium]|nr:hypothetical protein [Kiritimatiellia bacterium]
MRRLLSAVAVLALVTTVAQANLLLNADFGSGTLGQFNNGAVVDNWTIFGTADSGWYQDDIDANRSVKIWWDDVGIYQDFACTAGSEYLFSADARYRSTPDPLVSWHGYIKVEWYDGSWNPLGSTELDYISSSDSADTWHQLSGSATAAVGSVNGRLVFGLNNYVGDNAGAAYFDNANVDVAAIPEPTLAALLAVGLGVVRILRKRR